ncbi:MAG: hypothetical protein VZS44_00810 [Bacilli bacterium]|nr:hypothetical protein [Bacilli bacterium]
MGDFENYFSLINKGKASVDYKQFKDMFINYAEQVMNSFLNGKANCICIIKPLKKEHEGYETYDEKTNTYIIGISDDVVKEIYNGTKLFNIFTLFHEISHVYDEFNIDTKDFRDANLKKICIENGIMESMPTGGLFYYSNYKVMAIEAHADLIGSQLTRDFYKKCKIELNDTERKRLIFLEFFALQKLNNIERDYKFLFDGSLYNDFNLPLSKIVSEIKQRYPTLYKKLKETVGEENLTFEDEKELSEFETQLYDEYAIFDLSNIIKNPLFKSLVEEKTQHRPKL